MAILQLKLVTPPAVEPVSLALARQHARIISSADDALISQYIKAAREYCEHSTRRAFFNQTWKLTMDHLPFFAFWTGTGMATDRRDFWFWSHWWRGYEIKVPKPSLVSVTEIVYTDPNGTPVTLDPSSYIVDSVSEPGQIVPQIGNFWPWGSQYVPGGTHVTFVAGSYGDGETVDTCPGTVIQAILFLVSQWYSNPDGAANQQNNQRLYAAVDAMLDSERFHMLNYENN
jgi:uncharacterized phiE125 gp8 family phage protein